MWRGTFKRRVEQRCWKWRDPEDCKLSKLFAIAARVIEGPAIRPCGWGRISICSIWLEVALDIQSRLGLNIKFRWGI